MDTKTTNPRSRFPKIYGVVIAVLMLTLLLTLPAFALRQTNLVLTADTQRSAGFDVLASATGSSSQPAGGGSSDGGSSGSSTATKPKKPKLKAASAYAISKEAAIQLAKDSLQADDTWVVNEAKLKLDGKTPVYAVILTDPAGDAHLRLVNADTGAITVRSLWKAPASQKNKNKNSGGDSQSAQTTVTSTATKSDDRDDREENEQESERESERENGDD